MENPIYQNYRLISVSDSIDNLTGKKVSLYELTPIKYNQDIPEEYEFDPISNPENDRFIYLKNSKTDEYFLSEPEKIKRINLTHFDCVLIKTPEGLIRSHFSKELLVLRKNKDNWNIGSAWDLKHGHSIAFKFTHSETASIKEVYNEKKDDFDLIPVDSFPIKLKEIINYIVIDINSVGVYVQDENGSINNRFKGKIDLLKKDNKGKIIKIETTSFFKGTGKVFVNYDFDSSPIKQLQKSYKNVVITVFDNSIFKRVRSQSSLFFGEYLGVVKLNNKNSE